MNKNILYSIAILLASLTLWACGSDDEETPSGYSVETVSQAPAWQVNWTGNDSRPDWQEPNSADYENWTMLLLQVEDELKPYATENDLLALFVGDELRGLTGPARVVTDGEEIVQKGEFILKAFGNEADQNVMSVTLRYYCSQLKQTFSRTVEMTYEMGKVYGLDEDLIPQFTLGSSKYPVVTTMTLEPVVQAQNDIQPMAEDMVAAFVGDECRGVLTLNDQAANYLDEQLTVFGRQAGEVYTLKYYSNATQSIYTIINTVRQ